MIELTVEAEFAAAHAIVIRGEREPLHGHNWRVTATVGCDTLDADGLVCDFHAVESALRALTGRFHNRSLNDTPPFDKVNPTAELVARHLAEELARALHASLGPDFRARAGRVVSVRVTEAPGCAAVWRP